MLSRFVIFLLLVEVSFRWCVRLMAFMRERIYANRFWQMWHSSKLHKRSRVNLSTILEYLGTIVVWIFKVVLSLDVKCELVVHIITAYIVITTYTCLAFWLTYKNGNLTGSKPTMVSTMEILYVHNLLDVSFCPNNESLYWRRIHNELG